MKLVKLRQAIKDMKLNKAIIFDIRAQKKPDPYFEAIKINSKFLYNSLINYLSPHYQYYLYGDSKESYNMVLIKQLQNAHKIKGIKVRG